MAKPDTQSCNPIATPPSLQIPSPTSMGIAWGVKTLATGFVDYGTEPDLCVSTRVFAGVGPQKSLDDVALNVRLTGLKPNSRYYYRTGTIPIDFRKAYDIQPGAEVLGDIYSFKTAGEDAPSTFAVISDVHEVQEAMNILSRKIDELGCAVSIWNGDINSHCSDMLKIQQLLLNPGENGLGTKRPVVYMPGNHDYRGFHARDMHRIMMTREPSERDSKYHSLTRNYAFRQGEIALVGLDTGEDKADWRREWGQLANFSPYRRLQAEWLAETLEREDIKSAPYLVAICHIPIFDARPDANPGDTEDHYASWSRECNRLWAPHLNKHNIQLVIAGHCHKYRYDPADSERGWAQIVNGAGKDIPPEGQLTLISAEVAEGRLRVTVHDLTENSVLGEFAFAPRQ